MIFYVALKCANLKSLSLQNPEDLQLNNYMKLEKKITIKMCFFKETKMVHYSHRDLIKVWLKCADLKIAPSQTPNLEDLQLNNNFLSLHFN